MKNDFHCNKEVISSQKARRLSFKVERLYIHNAI